MRRKKVLENVSIEKMADKGIGLGRHNGMVVFVEKTVPGDVVDVFVTRKKRDFCKGTPIRFEEYSSLRTDSFCSHFGTCGGCKWQFIPYTEQLKFKADLVDEAFQRIGKLQDYKTLPIIGCKQQTYYRNKLEYTFSNRKWLTKEQIDSGSDFTDRNALGFHIPGRFDKILDIEHCYLQGDPSNEIRLAVKEIAIGLGVTFYDLNQQQGLLRNLVIRTSSIGEVMVILVIAEDDPKMARLILDQLVLKIPSITSSNYIINTKKNDSTHDQQVIHHGGKSFLSEQLGPIVYQLGPKSFFQTNSYQAKVLYDVIKDFAGLTGNEIVYDLYSGIGSIALYLSSGASKVIGVEIIEEAVADAKENARLNNCSNAEFFLGDIVDVLEREILEKKQSADVLVLDPPRAGLHPDLIGHLKNMRSKKIVYVSCNPATQARDIAMMEDSYRLIKIQPIDMFPQTAHMENVALLTLKD